MSGTHKYPTISFRISPREREEIEAKIFTSGMKKKALTAATVRAVITGKPLLSTITIQV